MTLPGPPSPPTLTEWTSGSNVPGDTLEALTHKQEATKTVLLHGTVGDQCHDYVSQTLIRPQWLHCRSDGWCCITPPFPQWRLVLYDTVITPTFSACRCWQSLCKPTHLSWHTPRRLYRCQGLALWPISMTQWGSKYIYMIQLSVQTDRWWTTPGGTHAADGDTRGWRRHSLVTLATRLIRLSSVPLKPTVRASDHCASGHRHSAAITGGQVGL